MKISLDWIRDYVKADLPLQELLDKLTMIGLVAESVEDREGDKVLDVETYANRPDTLGHFGMAREIATMLGLPLTEPAWPLTELSQKTSELADIAILDEEGCPRYCGLVVRNVTVGPSPDWLRRRIEAMGSKSINNVVDISNYVLFATAQPIHTFDLAKLAGSRIIVRRAKKGETLLDLEGRTLELDPDMLVIADESKPVALAGIIGGAESAVSPATRDIFIESANFDPVSVRLTAKKLGISTDASYRFERGADVSFAPRAALMAASLLTQAGGQVSQGVLDVYPRPRKAKSLVLRGRRITELLGIEVPGSFVGQVLTSLGFKVSPPQKDVWHVEIPSFRVDIDREADLIEEVARFYGYDRIPSEVTPIKSFEFFVNKKRDRVLRLRRVLLAQGFDEVINFSFADPEKEAVIGSGRSAIELRNPMSARASVLRTNLLMGLLENAAWNKNRGLPGVHVFEVGNIYYQKDGRHEEQLALGILTTGLLAGSGWQQKPAPTDFYVLKGAIEAVLANLRYEPVSFQNTDHAVFEPGQALAIQYRGQTVGQFGLIGRAATAAYALDQPVYAGEIDLDGLFEKQAQPFEYVTVPKFPGVSRDLSFLVDRNVAYQSIQISLDKLAPPLLEAFELSDRFSGPSIAADKVSLSIRFHYRHPKRTLLTEEVDRVERDIIHHLTTAFKIQLREG